MFTRQEQRGRGLSGLGLVVKTTTRFDPARIKARFTHWLDSAVEEMAVQAREAIRGSGMEPEEAGKDEYRNRAIAQGLSAGVTWSGEVGVPKVPSALSTYGMMAGKLAIGFVMPWVGIGLVVASFFGKKKKKMGMPWNAIYAQAIPYAVGATKQEELNRIAEEEARIKQEQFTEVQKVRGAEVVFKLPEGVTSITKGGALVIQPRSKPIEKRL